MFSVRTNHVRFVAGSQVSSDCFFLKQNSLSQNPLRLTALQVFAPLPLRPWQGRTLAPDVEKFLAKHLASSLFERQGVFEVVRHFNEIRIAVVTVAPARRLRACRPDATGHINQPHERVRNGVVDVRGYVTPQSTGQLRRRSVGGDYDGQPIRLYVVDIVTDNSELVGEILHHPDWDS